MSTTSSSSSSSSSSTTTTTTTTPPRLMRVYKRRTKMPGARQTLLENVFHSLEVSDLQSARETCRKWKAQVDNQGAVLARGGGADPAPAADPAVDDLEESWMDSIETILQHLKELHQLREVDVDVMVHFLTQEGIIKAP